MKSVEKMLKKAATTVRDQVLNDPRYPVSKIAGRLRPYLQVLADQFNPVSVILFGSYAHGEPDEHSDIDLLIISRDEETTPLKQRVKIREAWWKMPRTERLLPFDLVVVSPVEHERRLAHAAGFYDAIAHDGLRLL